MIANKSPFILKNFLLLNQQIEVVPLSAPTQINVFELFESYSLDIDFVVKNDDDKSVSLFMKVLINTDNSKKPGYIIAAEGVCIFEFDDSENLSPQDKFNFINYSGISICLNSIRAVIANVTSYCPFGKYNIPTIDVNSLVKEKYESLKK